MKLAHPRKYPPSTSELRHEGFVRKILDEEQVLSPHSSVRMAHIVS